MATTKGKQIITNVYLDPEVYAALKELSDNTGAPMAHYIRQGVETVLAKNGWTSVGGVVIRGESSLQNPNWAPPRARRKAAPKKPK